MTPLDWLKQERERLQAQIDRLRSGSFRIGHDSGSGWVDATEDHIAQSLASLAEYDLVIAQSDDLGHRRSARPLSSFEQPSLPF
jgi:hypothetical protein